jgi:hypothetical protein
MDFKVRALDFLSIYVKQSQPDSSKQLKLIQGLLKALTVAHKDAHTILFDRIKSVLAQIAKQSTLQPKEESKVDSGNGKECKMLLTEMMAMLLR